MLFDIHKPYDKAIKEARECVIKDLLNTISMDLSPIPEKTPLQYSTYRPTEQCNRCKGKCCQLIPGLYAPSQFFTKKNKLSHQKITKLLKSGLFKLDCWDKDTFVTEDVYFIRPAIVKEATSSSLTHKAYGGTCAFLSSDGCLLPDKMKPFGCMIVKPAEASDRPCIANLGPFKSIKFSFMLLWYNYQAELQGIVQAKWHDEIRRKKPRLTGVSPWYVSQGFRGATEAELAFIRTLRKKWIRKPAAKK